MPCAMAQCQNIGRVWDLYGSAVVAPLADRKPRILVLWMCGTNRCRRANSGKLRIGTSGEGHTA